MTNEEAINEIEMAISIIQQSGKDWLDERDIPWLEMAIEALKPKWIPCNVRMPSEDGKYLVTNKGGTYLGAWDNIQNVEVLGFAKNLKAVDKYDFDTEESGWFGYDNEFGYYKDGDVIAWMPLPEPYEGGAE